MSSANRGGRSSRNRLRPVVGAPEALEVRSLLSSGVAHPLRHVEVARLHAEKAVHVDATTAAVGKRAAINFNFYDNLKQRVEQLKNAAGYDKRTGKYDEGKVPEGRKALLLDNALANYKKLVGTTSNMRATHLANPSAFAIAPGKDPAYFSKLKFNANRVIQRDVQAGLYSYTPSAYPEKTQFWVDFANKQLGGGVFGNGFVQEETMFLETPELANAAALPKPIITRTGNNPGVLQGSPTPWVFSNVNRVMAISSAATKNDAWRTITVDQLKAADVPLAAAQNINVLSIAAPKLSQTGPKATLPIVKDLFNTFYAGFSLAYSMGGNQPIRIHTGPIGAGVFYNNRTVVYVMQRLAAMMAGKVNLTMWGYDTPSNPTEIEDADRNYLNPILARFRSASNQSVGNLLKIASQKMSNIVGTSGVSDASASFQSGSYVPVFAMPNAVESLAKSLNQRVGQIAADRGWKAAWTANVGNNVHTTVDAGFLDHQDSQTGQVDHLFSKSTDLDAVLSARGGDLKAMLARAAKPSNTLNFQGLHFAYDTAAGKDPELYLKVEFGADDQKAISRIVGKSSDSWHVTVGHFEVQSTDTQADIANKLSHLQVIANDTNMLGLLRSAKLPSANLNTIRIVHTDNANAQYPSYRDYVYTGSTNRA
ncbi:MAG: hypothetical protein U0800_03405 [Isosphaeraceae bacterium]